MAARSIVDSEVGEFNIPDWVEELASFRRWTEKDEELDFGRVGWLDGSVWIDMSREQAYSHNAVKTEFARATGNVVKEARNGRFFGDGMLLSNVAGDLCGQPDGMFILTASFTAGRCRNVPSQREGGVTEFEGTPDLVIEVVSRSSWPKIPNDFAKGTGLRVSRSIGSSTPASHRQPSTCCNRLRKGMSPPGESMAGSSHACWAAHSGLWSPRTTAGSRITRWKFVNGSPMQSAFSQSLEYGMELGAFSVSLAVKDLPASRAFYEKFGFTMFGGNPQQNWLILKNGDCILGLFQGMFDKNILTFNPGWDSNAQPLPTFTDVRELQRQLKTSGVQLMSEADESTTGPASFIAADPDGNSILVDQHV